MPTTGGNLGLKRAWAQGENGWATSMDMNLLLLDALAQPVVKGVGTNTPPGSPAQGDAYVVGTSPTGAWATKNNQIAIWDGAAWQFSGAPKAGWRVLDSSNAYTAWTFSGSAWLSHTDQACLRAINGVAPTSGVGLELMFGSGSPGTGYLTAYDRAGAAWQNLQLRANQIDFLTGGSIRGSFGSSGLLTLNNGLNLGQQDLTNYSEGTWTPTLTGSTGSAGAYAASIAVGHWTRVGRLVHAQAYIALSNVGSWTGTARISSLPFTSKSSSNAYMASPLGFISNITLSAGNTQLSAYTRTGETNADLVQSGSGIASTGLPYSGLANNSQIMAQLIYML